MDNKTEKLLIALVRLVVTNTGASSDFTALIAAMNAVEVSVDENKAEVILNTVALGLLDALTGIEIVGSGVVRTVTVAGASGTLGLDIDIGAGDVEYDEAFSSDVETTIDNWIASHAANTLANQGITATKASPSTILLTGSASAGNWAFTDGSATMTATAGLATVTGLDAATLAALASLETQVDLTTAAVALVEAAIANRADSQRFGINGASVSQTITVAGGSGTLGIDINTGDGDVAYDEAFASDVETTIDNWVTSHAANILANQGITATKASPSTILLAGSARSGVFTFTDGGATMTAVSAGLVVTALDADTIVALQDVELSVDENKAEVILVATALATLQTALLEVNRFLIAGAGVSQTLTIAGGSGTLGIDIDVGEGDVAYDEAFSSTVETTIDNWITSHAANILADQGITATKASASSILLVGSARSGNYTFTDGGATMTAVSGGISVPELASALDIASLETQIDLIKTAVDQLVSQSFGGAGFEVAGGVTTETLTVTGGSGTLGIDITSGSHAIVAYDEAFSVNIETTIDNWLVTNAANMLTAHGITATKASAATILLTGSVPAGIWTFADGGTTMVAASGGQATAMNTVTSDCSVIEVVADAVFDVATTVGFGDVLPFGHSATAGTKIVGNFTNIKLVSGVALCYVI